MRGMKRCSVEDCPKQSIAKGLCPKHYQRLKKHGTIRMDWQREWGQGTIHRGYKLIRVCGKQMAEHRHIMEQYLGRSINPREHIHHINGDTLDNKIENLCLIALREHSAIHRIGKYWHKGTSKTHKYCPKCRRVLPRAEFHPSKHRSRGNETVSSWCKMCMRHYQHGFVKSCPICQGRLLSSV